MGTTSMNKIEIWVSQGLTLAIAKTILRVVSNSTDFNKTGEEVLWEKKNRL